MVMKLSPFFKLLNRKINKYDKAATNPFAQPYNVIMIWVEDIKNPQPEKDCSEENN